MIGRRDEGVLIGGSGGSVEIFAHIFRHKIELYDDIAVVWERPAGASTSSSQGAWCVLDTLIVS